MQKYTTPGGITLCSDAQGVRLCLASPAIREGGGGSWPDFVEKFAVEEKANQPAVFKKLNFIEFQTDCAVTTTAFWLRFANSVRFDATERPDGINVMKMGPGRFIVTYHKNDQRKVTLPAGFAKRYVVPAAKASTPRVSMLKLFADLECVGAEQVGNMHLEGFTTPTAIDVVSAVGEMPPLERRFARLAAQMKAEKERTPLERALCQAWGTLGEILEAEGDASPG